MKRKLALLALAGFAASGAPGSRAAAAQAPALACSAEKVKAAGSAVRTARAELMATPLEDDQALVPPATSSRIERVKDRLRDFVRSEMACAPASPDVEALAGAMAGRSGFFSVLANAHAAPKPPDRHGDALDFALRRVDSHPDMLAVIATLAIKCGSDSMLMLYRREGGVWRELMVRRSEPYSEVKGGWGDLRFEVSPKDRQGGWFVATVTTTPWCTSAWQGMPYELARPGPAPDRPRVFFRDKNRIYLGNEDDLLVKAERDAFEIRHDGSSLDPDILVRRHIRRYSVVGESVRRVQPVAESVRDFADEWITAPWAEAKAWSGGDPALAAAHSGLQAARYETLGGFASIRACSGGATRIEIAGQDGPGWFLRVRGGAAGPWTMERVERRAGAGCAGPDSPGR
ncbi:MAG TPA: hypothetical protein VE891_16150 [Allosphingosinicella sp.]|nr:hypothetical protein [Allosphingosinicella sp.]